jgi:hypothetical protein
MLPLTSGMEIGSINTSDSILSLAIQGRATRTTSNDPEVWRISYTLLSGLCQRTPFRVMREKSPCENFLLRAFSVGMVAEDAHLRRGLTE